MTGQVLAAGINDSFAVIIVASAVLYGTPLLFAALGELLAERSGVINLGVEGMMLVGAVMGFWAVQRLDAAGGVSLAGALAVAAVAGGAMALIHAFLVITLRANQIVSGLALTIFAGAAGLSSYLGNDLNLSGSPADHAFSGLDVLGLGDVPVLGPIVFDQSALVYLSWALVVAIGIYLARTRPGLNLRAVGESPASADAMGIDVTAYRYIHTLAGGALAGIGGACFSLQITPQWVGGAHGRGRLDRGRARDLRVLAAGPLSRRRLPLRRVLRAALDATGARLAHEHPVRGLLVAAVRDDDRRARRGRLRRREAAAGQRPPRSAFRTCAKSVRRAWRNNGCAAGPRNERYPAKPS